MVAAVSVAAASAGRFGTGLCELELELTLAFGGWFGAPNGRRRSPVCAVGISPRTSRKRCWVQSSRSLPSALRNQFSYSEAICINVTYRAHFFGRWKARCQQLPNALQFLPHLSSIKNLQRCPGSGLKPFSSEICDYPRKPSPRQPAAASRLPAQHAGAACWPLLCPAPLPG